LNKLFVRSMNVKLLSAARNRRNFPPKPLQHLPQRFVMRNFRSIPGILRCSSASKDEQQSRTRRVCVSRRYDHRHTRARRVACACEKQLSAIQFALDQQVASRAELEMLVAAVYLVHKRFQSGIVIDGALQRVNRKK